MLRVFLGMLIVHACVRLRFLPAASLNWLIAFWRRDLILLSFPRHPNLQRCSDDLLKAVLKYRNNMSRQRGESAGKSGGYDSNVMCAVEMLILTDLAQRCVVDLAEETSLLSCRSQKHSCCILQHNIFHNGDESSSYESTGE